MNHLLMCRNEIDSSVLTIEIKCILVVDVRYLMVLWAGTGLNLNPAAHFKKKEILELLFKMLLMIHRWFNAVWCV